MTKQEAVEKVTKALLRDSGYPDHHWRAVSGIRRSCQADGGRAARSRCA